MGPSSMPSVIEVRTKPGRMAMTEAPSRQAVAQALGEGVEAGLGGAVDEVVGPGPLAGHRGDDREGAVALGLELVGDGQARRHGAGVVDDGGLGGGRGVVVERVLVAEHAEGEQDQVEVGVVGPDAVDDRLVAVGVGGVERDQVDGGDAGGPQLVGDRLELGGVAAGEHHRAGALLGQLLDRGEGDVGAAAQDQDGFQGAEGVSHGLGLLGARRGRGGQCRTAAGAARDRSVRWPDHEHPEADPRRPPVRHGHPPGLHRPGAHALGSS